MSKLYKQYLRLLEKWPVNPSKADDLGQHLRNEVKKAFSKGELSNIANKEQCERNYESLNRIASNYYGDKYSFPLKSTATGIEPEVCSQILSQDFQKVLTQKKLGRFARIKESIKHIFKKSMSAKS